VESPQVRIAAAPPRLIVTSWLTAENPPDPASNVLVVTFQFTAPTVVPTGRVNVPPFVISSTPPRNDSTLFVPRLTPGAGAGPPAVKAPAAGGFGAARVRWGGRPGRGRGAGPGLGHGEVDRHAAPDRGRRGRLGDVDVFVPQTAGAAEQPGRRAAGDR